MSHHPKHGKRAVIATVTACDMAPATDQDCLLSLFENAMRDMAATGMLWSMLHTGDSAALKARGCQNFTLNLRRIATGQGSQWQGEFRRANECLTIVGRLADDDE